ncbi:MAG: ribosome silencing factor [Steroidobacter sp.]
MAVKRAKTSRRSNPSTAKAKTALRPVARKTASNKNAAHKTAAKKAAVKKGPRKSAPATKPKVVQGAVVKVVAGALDEMKAVNVTVLNVDQLTDITDTMIIASGNSDRHVRSIADRVIEYAKKAGFRPTGVEGERDGEWVLVDLQDVIVHIMLPRVREFYRLESLWDVSAARREAAGGSL